MMVKVLVCSTCILDKVMGPPLRGLVHSSFAAAANLIFADGFLLSLNASSSLPGHPTPQNEDHRAITFVNAKRVPRVLHSQTLSLDEKRELLMPNGLLLSAHAGEYPFDELQPGMPVVLGAGWLSLEAVACSLDFMSCARWNPRIDRPAQLDEEPVRSNGLWLAQLCRREGLRGMPEFEMSEGETILALAERLCGRGPGLTPGGDDFLAGWLAAGWLLYGPLPSFLAIGQQITRLTRTRTHALSQCWLDYAAAGDVALPVGELLVALTTSDQARLERAARNVLALGATSGFDLLQGVLFCIAQFRDSTLQS